MLTTGTKWLVGTHCSLGCLAHFNNFYPTHQLASWNTIQNSYSLMLTFSNENFSYKVVASLGIILFILTEIRGKLWVSNENNFFKKLK